MTSTNNSAWDQLTSQCTFQFPDLENIEPEIGDLIAIGADLEPETLLYAYSHGYFPMHLNEENEDEKTIGWFSPKSRAIFTPDSIKVTRSMKQSYKKYECRIDTCFKEMMEMCKNIPRPLGWIDDEFIEKYLRLHELGFAHSVEVFQDEELVGGLYGVGFASFFAGESMVHKKRDASKVALMHLMEITKKIGVTLIDAQWMTDHLQTLGAKDIPRSQYLVLLEQSLAQPQVTWPTPGKLV